MPDTFVTAFNACEAALWALLAVVVAVAFRKSDSGMRRVSRFTAAFFGLFAVSDVIEMYTGAWWRPTGLLIFKGICVLGLTVCFAMLLRGARRVGRAKQPMEATDRR